MTETTIEKPNNEKERLMKLTEQIPTNNQSNSIPKGKSKITFLGLPQEKIGDYNYDKGDNPGPLYHIIVPARLYLSETTTSRVTQIEHPLGLCRTAFQSLLSTLMINKEETWKLKDRTFTCENKNNKRYV